MTKTTLSLLAKNAMFTRPTWSRGQFLRSHSCSRCCCSHSHAYCPRRCTLADIVHRDVTTLDVSDLKALLSIFSHIWLTEISDKDFLYEKKQTSSGYRLLAGWPASAVEGIRHHSVVFFHLKPHLGFMSAVRTIEPNDGSTWHSVLADYTCCIATHLTDT